MTTRTIACAPVNPNASERRWEPPALLLELGASDPELIANLIVTFQEDTTNRMSRIREAVANADFCEVRAQAHTIKGGARELGAEAVAEACQALEKMSKDENVLLVAAQVGRVAEALEMAQRDMAAYSREYSPASPRI